VFKILVNFKSTKVAQKSCKTNGPGIVLLRIAPANPLIIPLFNGGIFNFSAFSFISGSATR